MHLRSGLLRHRRGRSRRSRDVPIPIVHGVDDDPPWFADLEELVERVVAFCGA
jgi:hypothetical protein